MESERHMLRLRASFPGLYYRGGATVVPAESWQRGMHLYKRAWTTRSKRRASRTVQELCFLKPNRISGLYLPCPPRTSQNTRRNRIRPIVIEQLAHLEER